MTDGKTALYRHFDASGALLYVGISLSAASRLAAHIRGSEWAAEISNVSIEYLPTREAALSAEKAAIIAEVPAWNKTHKIKKIDVVDVRVMEQEPAYIKLYIEDISQIFNLQQGHQEILTYVAASVDYQGIVSLTIRRKARIAAIVNCSVKSIDNAISEYVNQGILARIGRGEYELDPHLFARGKWRDIQERRMGFKTTITYTPKGCETVMDAI